MKLLFELSFNWANITATFIFIFCLGYWLTVLIGVLDFSALDFDVDVEVDADVELDAGGEVGVGWFNHVLSFFNLGKVPFMIWLTILSLACWVITVDINYIIGNSTLLIGLAVTLVGIIGGAVVAKIVTQPFLKFFASLDQHDLKVDLTGAIGVVKLPINKGERGQVSVRKGDSTHLISAKLENVELELSKGQKVLVIGKDDAESDTYIVQAYNE